jgi:hypothetical protein
MGFLDRVIHNSHLLKFEKKEKLWTLTGQDIGPYLK